MKLTFAVLLFLASIASADCDGLTGMDLSICYQNKADYERSMARSNAIIDNTLHSSYLQGAADTQQYQNQQQNAELEAQNAKLNAILALLNK